MKRALHALTAVMVVAMLLVGPVAAATSQGLEWGIAVGDQWNFDITSTEDGATDFSEVMYFEVDTRPTIPNILSTWAEVPNPGMDITWENGTSLGWSALIFIFYVVAIDTWAVPIGNYTLLGELYEDSIYNGTVTDAGGYWGVDLDFEFFGEDVEVHVDFLKEDGMLAHWDVTTYNGTEVAGTLNMVRQGLPSGFDIIGFVQDNLLLVGVGVVAIVIIGAIVCRKK